MKKVIGICFFLTQLLHLENNAQVITTFAGTGTAGFNGDNQSALIARLRNPAGVAIDSIGNIYIADRINHRIRKVDTAGLITTVAGTGIAGYNGDGILATTARVNNPTDVEVDRLGNLIICDQSNNRIRYLDMTTGMISTIAGTGVAGFNSDGILANTAQVNFPWGVSVDDSNNIYIADFLNNRIREISVTTGLISTIAGTGTAGFLGDGGLATAARINQASGVAVDSLYNVYIADFSNNRIRKVDKTTGFISTIAGTGTAGALGDNGPATLAQLNGPINLTVDNQLRVFIADENNHEIRLIHTNGNIYTIAGTGIAGNTGDGGPAFLARLNLPTDVLVTSTQKVFVPVYNNHKIRTFDPVCIPPQAPTVSASSLVICSGQPVNLSVTAGNLNDASNWEWTSVSCGGTMEGNGSSISVAPSVTTTYYARGMGNCVTGGNCQSITITVNPAPTVTCSANITSGCSGDTVILNGNGALTYIWDNGVVDNSPFVPSVSSINYIVTGTDMNGCSDTSQINVTINANPTVVANAVSANVCENDSVLLFGSGAFSYSWDNGVTDSVAFTPAPGSITYTVIGTDINGCVNSDQIMVSVDTVPVVTANASDTLVCSNDSIVLFGNGAVTYTWDNGVTDNMAFIQQPADTITYTVNGYSTNGCSASAQIMVISNVQSQIVSSSATDVSCFGTCDGSATVNTLFTGSISYSLSWNDPMSQTDSVATSLCAGSYLVTITNQYGCVDTEVVTINSPTAINLSATSTDEISGNDGSIDLSVSGGSPGYTFSWDNGATTEDISSLTGGNYTVTVTDSMGCSDSLTVTVNSFVGISIDGDADEIQVYPVPFSDVLMVNMKLNANVIIELFDITGKKVFSKTTDRSTNELGVSAISPGIYTLSVASESWNMKRMVVKE